MFRSQNSWNPVWKIDSSRPRARMIVFATNLTLIRVILCVSLRTLQSRTSLETIIIDRLH